MFGIEYISEGMSVSNVGIEYILSGSSICSGFRIFESILLRYNKYVGIE